MSINPSQTPGYIPSAAAAPQSQAAYTPPPVYQPTVAATPSGGSGKIGVLFGAVVALIAGNVYTYYQVNQLKDQLSKYQTSVQAEIDKVNEANNVTSQSNRRTVEQLRDQLETARRQAALAAGQAKQEALKRVDETNAKLAAAEAKQAQEVQQVTSQVQAVKQSADTANAKVESVNNDVNTVKTDLGATKSQLEKTIADLKTTQGDLNGQGVLIATNGKELAALRALGERNYIEFTIHKSKEPQKVGDVQVELKKADTKHNRYTIELTADDKKVEKKDRTINEPLQFFTSKAKQPYELVVNDVKKDTIIGYLSIPKVMNGR